MLLVPPSAVCKKPLNKLRPKIMAAILFGSLNTVANTSELHRQAFNQTFRRCGIDWHWDRDFYLSIYLSIYLSMPQKAQ